MEIEEVAAKTPEKVIKEPLHPTLGMQPYVAREVAFKLGFAGKRVNEVANLIMNLAKAFYATDASLAEINPLVITKDDKLVAIDAKFNFDDNAGFRQKKLLDMAEPQPGERARRPRRQGEPELHRPLTATSAAL